MDLNSPDVILTLFNDLVDNMIKSALLHVFCEINLMIQKTQVGPEPPQIDNPYSEDHQLRQRLQTPQF